jgi:hypothetical protein
MLQNVFFRNTTVVVAGIAIALFLAGCDKEDNKVALSSIEVTPASVELTVGDTEQLTATATPKDAADVAFVWSSGSTAVATVSTTGLVTAISPGNTTVKVASNGIEKSVPVTVNAAFVPALAVTPAVAQIASEGGSLEFNIDANADWTYTGANEWLKEAAKTATALTLTVDANASITNTRGATLTFSLTGYPNVTQAVTVSQSDNLANINEEDFGPGITPTVLIVTSGDELKAAEGLPAGNYVVNIAGNMTLSDAADNSTNITLGTPGVTISLRGVGNIISPANDAGIVRINEGKLILRGVTLSKTGNAMPTVWVTANGMLEINDGASITGTGESTNAGVRVQGGHVLMKGGEIHGHRNAGGGGAGMYLYSNGVFQMDGGKIYDNTAGYAGGIFIMGDGARFIMNGGEMYDNHSNDAYEGGGAVYIWQNGSVEIHSGAVIYGKDGGDGKAGNTAPQNGDTYGHAVSAFYNGSSGKYRSTTIQNEELSITLSGGSETELSGSWVSF